MTTPLSGGGGKSSVSWVHDFEEARKRAQAENKLILLDFFSPT